MDKHQSAVEVTPAATSSGGAAQYAPTIFWLGWIAMLAPLGVWFAVDRLVALSGGLFVCWFIWMLLAGTATAIAALGVLRTAPGETMPDLWRFFAIIALEVAVAGAIGIEAFGGPRMAIQPWTEMRALPAEVIWV